MPPQLLLLQLAAVCATASAVIPVNVLPGGEKATGTVRSILKEEMMKMMKKMREVFLARDHIDDIN